MACTLIDLDNQVDCPVSDGGIVESRVAECIDITAVTIEALTGIITAFTMASTGLWKKLVYDDDDTAFFNQEGVRVNNKHTFTQTAFMKFAGVNNDKRLVVEGLTPCCCLVVVHFLSNGTAVVQGLENLASLTTWRTSKKKAKVTANVMTDTAANEDRVEFNFISESRNSSMFTDLTAAELDAL